jgi:phospholipid transport system substrate-binding protein
MTEEKPVTGFTRWARASTALLALSWSLVSVVPADAASETPATPPTNVVETLHAALVGVMKDADELGYQGRCDRLSPALRNLYDISFMAQKSVGRHWKVSSEGERQHLLETFTGFMIAKYAGNFDGYSGQTFETLGEEQSTRGTMLVRTRLVEPDGEATQLNYRLRPVDGEWKIIDVYLNGTVSELALRRSEYSSLIQREGFDSLLVALNQKITNLSESTPAKRGP